MKHLLIKYFREELDSKGQKELNEWLDSSSENQHVFDEYKLIWDESATLRKSYVPDTHTKWDELLALVNNEPSHTSYRYYGIAASILVLIGVLLFLSWPKSSQVDYVADEHSLSSVLLPDSTVVWIKKGSALSFANEKGFRSVTLQGEAFFEVNRDETRPFVIKTGQVSTRVLGTSFNVDASNEENVKLVVVTGKVLFFNESDSVYLIRGEIGDYSKSSKTLTSRVNTDVNFDAWKTGILTFDNTPLTDVVSVLSVQYEVQFEPVENTDARLTGTFDNQTLDKIIKLIEMSTEVRIKETSK